jgi:hypothetical protein
LSSTTEMLMETLLSQNRDGQGSGNINDTLTQLAQNNPRMAPLVRHMQERLAESSKVVDITPESGQANQETIDLSPSATEAGIDELKDMAESMSAELEVLRARNDMLATALGACHLCWGDDQECPYCNGAGHVGAYVISLSVFERIIGPAVRQLKRRPQLAKQPQPIGKGENHGA